VNIELPTIQGKLKDEKAYKYVTCFDQDKVVV